MLLRTEYVHEEQIKLCTAFFVNSSSVSVIIVSCLYSLGLLSIKTECLEYPLAPEIHDRRLLESDTIAVIAYQLTLIRQVIPYRQQNSF